MKMTRRTKKSRITPRNLGGVGAKTRITKKPSAHKTRTTPKPTVRTIRTARKPNVPPPLPSSIGNTATNVVCPNEGEDIVEAHLSVLISLIGGSCCEEFIGLMNETYNIRPQIEVVQVSKPMNPTPAEFSGRPTIFYGRNSTHFTCTVDGTRDYFLDSYTTDIQKTSTDHFCQTFAIMAILNGLIPDTEWGSEFTRLDRGAYVDNAYIAKQFACKIMRFLDDRVDVSEYVVDVINETDRLTQKRVHTISPTFTLDAFLVYCEKVSRNDMCVGSFREKIYRCLGRECNQYSC